MKIKKPTTIDEYIEDFPSDTQEILQQMRTVIKSVIPMADEKISYQIPTFTIDGFYVVYFAGFKNHVGFYPAPVGIDEFRAELSGFKTGKGSVQFPLDRPLPLDLIVRMVQFRKEEVLNKRLVKKK